MSDSKPIPMSTSIPGSPYQFKSLLQTGWFYPLLACFVLLLLLSAKQIGSYELGTHLKAGQWIGQNHSAPDKDHFTYTQTSRDYLDSNGLYQVLLYLLQNNFGYPSLVLLGLIVLAAFFFLFLWRVQIFPLPPLRGCLFFLFFLPLLLPRCLLLPPIFIS